MDAHRHAEIWNDLEGAPPRPLPQSAGIATCTIHPGDASASARQPQRRTWSTRTLASTGVACFICGAIAWHMIGFWTFVSGIMFNLDGTETAVGLPDTLQQASASQDGTPSPKPDTTAPTTAMNEHVRPAARSTKAPDPIAGTHRPPANSETLADLLQCAEARKRDAGASVHACPPMRRRLPIAAHSSRGNRQLDAREAAQRLTDGWQTGVATIETGSLPPRR